MIKRLNAFHLNGLRAVEAVLRLGSLQKAADELGVSPSAVSQQINRTEDQIGRILFLRTRSGLTPSEFGSRLGARLSSGFRELEEAAALTDDPAENTLTVSVAPAFASRFLVPRMMRFFELHPEILMRIDASVHLADLDRSDVDLGLRLGDGNWTNVQAEKLIDMDVFPICAPSIAAKLANVGDMAKAYVISDSSTMISWDDWFRQAGTAPIRMQQGATFTDVLLCLDAVIAGHGVMLGWQMLAGDALADGRLVEPFGIRAKSGFAHYFVTPRNRKEPRKVTLFKNWVRREVEFAGECIVNRGAGHRNQAN